MGATHRHNHRKAVILDNCVTLVQLWWTASTLCTCCSLLAVVGGHKIPASDTSGSLDPIFHLLGSWKTKDWIQNKHWLQTSTRTSLVKLARLQGQVLHFNGLHSFCGIIGLELVTLYASYFRGTVNEDFFCDVKQPIVCSNSMVLLSVLRWRALRPDTSELPVYSRAILIRP